MLRFSFHLLLSLLLSTILTTAGNAQKLSLKKKPKADIFECGYVYKAKLGSKLNPMKALQKGLAGTFTGETSELSKAAISIFYQGHLFPREMVGFITKTEGWQTCGDAVYIGMTNKAGMGILKTDGTVTMNGMPLEHAGTGTYFQGFSDGERGEKTVEITSSNGEQVNVSVGPAESLEIISVNGKQKGEEITIDGTEDVEIILANGDADPTSRIHIGMVSRSVGTKLLYDVFISKAQNRIVIPKEAFYNYEGSPTPFIKDNILIVNRVQEKIIENTSAGALRTLSTYTDWLPITAAGDITDGTIMTNGFNSEKNTEITFSHGSTYSFQVKKPQPFYSPPVKNIKKVAIASFFLRANMEDDTTTVSTTRTPTSVTTWTTKITKWFPEYDKKIWDALAAKMYLSFKHQLESEFGIEVVPIEQVVNAQSYRYIHPIMDSVSQTMAEVGYGGSQRMLTTSMGDVFDDLSITFAGDFVGSRLQKELDVDAVIALTFDLNFDFHTEGLDPTVSIAFFGPGTYKQNSKYLQASAHAKGKSLEDMNKNGGPNNLERLYYMIHGDDFVKEFSSAMKELKAKESAQPVYELLWKGME